MSDETPAGKPRPSRWRWLKRLAAVLGIVALVLALLAGGVLWYLNPPVERTNGVVYGMHQGKPLTLDVVEPRNGKNGLGIALLVSGSWKSNPDAFRVWLAGPLLRAGFTVFAVSHISQPEAKVQDTVLDMHRAIRFIRYHAKEYGIDPGHIGVTGGSAGGHLSLMLATRGGPGPADAPDPVDRESSAVQAVGIFFPVTNLYDLGTSRENAHDGGPPKSFRKSFGPEVADRAVWREIAHSISPVDHVHAGQPPVLIFHGDADTLVPLEQSEWFQEKAKAVGAEVVVKVRPGKRHGWLLMPLDIAQCAGWFSDRLSRSYRTAAE